MIRLIDRQLPRDPPVTFGSFGFGAEFTVPGFQSAQPLRLALVSLALAGGLIRAESATGQIRIDCEAGMTITLDGVSAGVTTYANKGATLDNVPAGQRRIGVTRAGFKSEEKRVSVEPGKMEVIAVFSLRPDPGADLRPLASSPNPLKALADAQSIVLERTNRLAALDAREPVGKDYIETDELRLEQSRERAAAGHAYREAITQLTVVEVAVSGQFRADYAAFQLLSGRTGVSTEQKNTAWRRLASQWDLPAEVGPSLLVWRQHRVDVARGNLRIKVSGGWPVQLGAPKHFIDGREVAPTPAAGGDASVAEFRGLTAGSHTLRIVHPAVELAEVTLPVEDGKTVNITWAPNFKSPQPKP
jgi:hypothetical protein